MELVSIVLGHRYGSSTQASKSTSTFCRQHRDGDKKLTATTVDFDFDASVDGTLGRLDCNVFGKHVLFYLMQVAYRDLARRIVRTSSRARRQSGA